jgi:hypothetical protein
LAAASAAFAAATSLFGGNRRQQDAREVSRAEGAAILFSVRLCALCPFCVLLLCYFRICLCLFLCCGFSFLATLCQLPESRPSEEIEIIPLHFQRSSLYSLSWAP